MPLEIIRADITKLEVDAIVNAAKSSLLGGSGVDGAIHSAAGKELLEECKKLNGCDTGMAKITKGYKLPAKYVIHTVGPIWRGGDNDEEKYLTNCYINSLELAKKYGVESIAFPIISSGAYGYPKDKAIEVATNSISKFLQDNDMLVYLVVYDSFSFKISEKLFNEIKEYIDDNYIDMSNTSNRRMAFGAVSTAIYDKKLFHRKKDKRITSELEIPTVGPIIGSALLPKKEEHEIKECLSMQSYLEDKIENLEDTFSQRLLKLIDEKGKTDVEVYKKANIDRKLFSKIRSDVDYQPKKKTALAFALALELSIDETKDFLQTCGYALSRSSKFDMIVEYFIKNSIYNVFEINNALFAFGEKAIAD